MYYFRIYSTQCISKQHLTIMECQQKVWWEICSVFPTTNVCNYYYVVWFKFGKLLSFLCCEIKWMLNIYCPDLILHLQGVDLQYLTLWHLSPGFTLRIMAIFILIWQLKIMVLMTLVWGEWDLCDLAYEDTWWAYTFEIQVMVFWDMTLTMMQ